MKKSNKIIVAFCFLSSCNMQVLRSYDYVADVKNAGTVLIGGMLLTADYLDAAKIVAINYLDTAKIAAIDYVEQVNLQAIDYNEVVTTATNYANAAKIATVDYITKNLKKVIALQEFLVSEMKIENVPSKPVVNVGNSVPTNHVADSTKTFYQTCMEQADKITKMDHFLGYTTAVITTGCIIVYVWHCYDKAQKIANKAANTQGVKNDKPKIRFDINLLKQGNK